MSKEPEFTMDEEWANAVKESVKISYELSRELYALGVVLEVDMESGAEDLLEVWAQYGHKGVVSNLARIIQKKAKKITTLLFDTDIELRTGDIEIVRVNKKVNVNLA